LAREFRENFRAVTTQAILRAERRSNNPSTPPLHPYRAADGSACKVSFCSELQPQNTLLTIAFGKEKL